MPKGIDNLCGKRFGKLKVIALLDERQDRYATYRCQCDCGETVIANSKRLKRGTVRACPQCDERKRRIQYDLTGQQFGKLTVEGISDAHQANGRVWKCRCDCGNFRYARSYDLRTGRIRSCGCDHPGYPYRNLKGMRIGMLTALEMTERRTAQGSVIWKCRCDCGTEKYFSEDALLHGRTISCGCYRQSVLTKVLNQRLHHIDGTCVEFLQRKMRTDNTSGYTGVRQVKSGKYTAFISFKKKRYHLGTFDTLDEAVRARKRGEEMHDDFLRRYYLEHPDDAKGRRRLNAGKKHTEESRYNAYV